MSVKAVFLDRDGVVTKAIVRDGKPFSPRTLDEFHPVAGAKPILQKIRDAGFILFIVSNQPDIARGKMEISVLEAMNKCLLEWMGKELISGVFICPHDNADHCECRKPKPGLLLQAHQTIPIDFHQSYMVGDRDVDMEAGRAVSCKTILIDAAYNRQVPCDYRAADLKDACRWIIEQESGKSATAGNAHPDKLLQ